MSSGKKFFVTLAVLSVLAFGGYQYFSSADYLARRDLNHAATALEQGRLVAATTLYAGVAGSGTSLAGQGRDGLRAVLGAPGLASLTAADTSEVFRAALEADATEAFLDTDALNEQAWRVIDRVDGSDPVGAYAVLDAVRSLQADTPEFLARKKALLENVVAAAPTHRKAAVELALLMEAEGDCARCEALLQPHADKLGISEGARLLGQIYAATGKPEASYQLLWPYTKEKLSAYTRLNTEYYEMVERIQDEAFQGLRNGEASEQFYRDYDQADEQRQREMVGNYLDFQLSSSAELAQHIEVLREASSIVPVALDLGIVTVQRAQGLTDPAEREAQFKSAEETFMAIRGVAGDSDEFRLYLGQVYYWLGRQDEGKALFDELLEANERSAAALMGVGNVLRSVGALAEARQLVEEAYSKADDDEQRWYAAHFRSVMFVDSEDQLKWLERADPSSVRVKASIHATRADLALGKNDRDTAKRELELAASQYEKMPVSAPQLNAMGLMYLSLYSISGDADDLAQGVAKLEEALGFSPSDSVLLVNNMSAVSTAAYAALVSEQIDLGALKISADIGLLNYLYDDAASYQALAQRVGAHADIDKTLSYSDKAMLLAPKNLNAYSFAAVVHMFLRDADALNGLTERMTGAGVDLSDREQLLDDIYAGKRRVEDVERLRATARHNLERLRGLPASASAATRAVARSWWLSSQFSLADRGEKVDANKLVSFARETLKLHPSRATGRDLTEALVLRATDRLAGKHQAFGEALARFAEFVDRDSLLVVYMDADPAFRAAALNDADVQEVVKRTMEARQRYPDQISAWTWALMKHADAERAAAFASQVKNDDFYAAQRGFVDVAWFRDAETLINRFLFAQLKGDRKEMKQVLDFASQANVPLPSVMAHMVGAQPNS